jgi:hypothetical protein
MKFTDKCQVKPKKQNKVRLLDPLSNLVDSVYKACAFSLDNIHCRDKIVLLGVYTLMFRLKNKTFSQSLISAETGLCQSSISKSLDRLIVGDNDLFGYSNNSNCSNRKILNRRKINKNAKVLVIQHNGYSVREKDSYNKNDIKENMLSYIPNEDFVNILPYLARYSVFCAKLFAIFRKNGLVTKFKRSVLKSLNIRQVQSFSRFSVAAINWAKDRYHERLRKHIKINDKERFLWSVCSRYDKEYNMLRE